MVRTAEFGSRMPNSVVSREIRTSLCVNSVTACAISADGPFIVSASLDKTLKICDVASGQERATLQGHGSYVMDCAISPDGSFIVSAGLDNTLMIWDAASGEKRTTLAGHTQPVNGCAISPNASLIVSASWDHTLRIWDAVSGAERAILDDHAGEVIDCAFNRRDCHRSRYGSRSALPILQQIPSASRGMAGKGDRVPDGKLWRAVAP
jgi:WD40 repeat protein